MLALELQKEMNVSIYILKSYDLIMLGNDNVIRVNVMGIIVCVGIYTWRRHDRLVLFQECGDSYIQYLTGGRNHAS
jgi:hypothetical protein